MRTKTLVALAVGAGLAVVAIPWILPTGPDTQIDIGRYLAGGQLAAAAAVVFLGGLLTSLTPCVYPLIPITVSIFGAKKDTPRGKSILLTSAYVVGMGLVFSILGVAAAKTGAAFGSVLGNPWVVAGLALFLLLLASSMFGAFELALPQSWTQRLSTVGGTGIAGALLMGAASGFLAAPCTGPVLTGLLAFVAQTQSTYLGGGLLFIYALGIGVPFFLIGVFALKLPRGGVWMDWVKSVLGITLVVLAATYIRDVMPALRGATERLASELGHSPGAWIAGVLTAVGIFSGAVHLSFKSHWREVAAKGLGVAVIVGALLIRIGVLNHQGQGELWTRMGLLSPPAPPPEMVWRFRFPQQGAELSKLDQALASARSENKPVMIDFYADWCAACKELDRKTYVAAPVITESERFVNIKVDATNEDEFIESLYDRFDIHGLPTVAFVTSAGQVLQSPRVVGFLSPDRFVDEVRKVR